MRFSSAQILSVARPDGFDEGVVEKVFHLVHLLNVLDTHPSLLTSDTNLQQRIQVQPLLEWKALNVRRHKGLS